MTESHRKYPRLYAYDTHLHWDQHFTAWDGVKYLEVGDNRSMYLGAPAWMMSDNIPPNTTGYVDFYKLLRRHRL